MDTDIAAPEVVHSLPKVRPAERPLSTLGLLRAMVNDPVAAVPRAAYEEPCVRTRTRGGDILYLSAPDLVEAVLVHRHENFAKSRIDPRLFEPMLGRSLLTLEGQDWRWQRRLSAPAFRLSTLSAYLPVMRAPFEELALGWQQTPGPQRVHSAMTAATIDVICRTFFSDFGHLDAGRVSGAINRYLGPVSWTVTYGTLGLPSFTPHPGKLRMWRAAKEGRRLVRDFVTRRRSAQQGAADLAQSLMDARDPETGRALSDDDVVSLFLTLIAAGHETSANALTWALYCLAAQPERQEALAARVRQVIGDGPVEPTHLDSLEEVRRFIEETMRLFPPVPLMSRRALRDCEIGTELITAGSLIFIPIYAIHRHRALWSEPDLFDPERFEASSERMRPRCAYMPFGTGPRICIGASFARLEMLAGLATLLARAKFLLSDTSPPEPVFRITLRPRRGVVLHVATRG